MMMSNLPSFIVFDEYIVHKCFPSCLASMHLNGLWIATNVLTPLKHNTKQKPSFSSSTLLLFGILLEDIPQLVVTYLIEDQTKSNKRTSRISGSLYLNLTFAIFDMAHKIAKALDLSSDVHNAGYAYKK